MTHSSTQRENKPQNSLFQKELGTKVSSTKLFSSLIVSDRRKNRLIHVVDAIFFSVIIGNQLFGNIYRVIEATASPFNGVSVSILKIGTLGYRKVTLLILEVDSLSPRLGTLPTIIRLTHRKLGFSNHGLYGLRSAFSLDQHLI